MNSTLTSHLGDSGTKNRPKSCTTHGIVPAGKKKKAKEGLSEDNF